MSPGPEEEEAGPGLGSARPRRARIGPRGGRGARDGAFASPARPRGNRSRTPSPRQRPWLPSASSRGPTGLPGNSCPSWSRHQPIPRPPGNHRQTPARAARSSRARWAPCVGAARNAKHVSRGTLPARALSMACAALQVRWSPPSPGPLRLSLEARWAPRKDQRVSPRGAGDPLPRTTLF